MLKLTCVTNWTAKISPLCSEELRIHFTDAV